MEQARWRHAWATFVVGAIAVTAIALIAFVVSSQPGKRPDAGAPMLLSEVPQSPTPPASSLPHPTSSPAPSSSRAPAAAPATSRPSTRAASTTAVALQVVTSSAASVPTTQPARPPAVCPSDAPCAVNGDGGVVAALSAYRRGHGRPAVGGSVSSAAQRCALTRGDGATCAQPFATAELSSQDGERAIANIRSGAGNWLLDPRLDGVSVGWAYHARVGVWVCALIAS